MDDFEDRCKHEQYSEKLRVVKIQFLIMDSMSLIIHSIDELYPEY